jgi:Methyltransferase domain
VSSAIAEASRTRAYGSLGYALRVSKAFVADPHEAVERALEKLSEWHDQRVGETRYPVSERPEERVHQLIHEPWPCDQADAFAQVWKDTLNELGASGLRIGRGAFGGWDDGDRRLVRLAWCLARHLRPERILETGVGRGLTTRALLEALRRNGTGHLWSIDLPPLLEHGLHRETAAAVPQRLRDDWTLALGSSRRELPRLVADIRPIGLFVHDSMHTTRNVSFELELVWPALSVGAGVLIDDVEKNTAVPRFLRAHPETPAVFLPSEDEDVLIACLVKPEANG